MLKPATSHQKRTFSKAQEIFAANLAESPEALAYLEERRIGARTAATLGLGVVNRANAPDGYEWLHGRLSIPYHTIEGQVVWHKFRALPGLGEGAVKYAQQEGGRRRLYNLRALTAPGDTMCLVEGEFDAISLTALGIPAVGIPGSKHWQSWMRRALDGYQRYVMFIDNDDAGKGLGRAVKNDLPDLIIHRPPGGHNDISDAYLDGCGNQIRRLALGLEEEHRDEPERPTEPATEAAHPVQPEPAEPDHNQYDGISNPDGPVPF